MCDVSEGLPTWSYYFPIIAHPEAFYFLYITKFWQFVWSIKWWTFMKQDSSWSCLKKIYIYYSSYKDSLLHRFLVFFFLKLIRQEMLLGKLLRTCKVHTSLSWALFCGYSALILETPSKLLNKCLLTKKKHMVYIECVPECQCKILWWWTSMLIWTYDLPWSCSSCQICCRWILTHTNGSWPIRFENSATLWYRHIIANCNEEHFIDVEKWLAVRKKTFQS